MLDSYNQIYRWDNRANCWSIIRVRLTDEEVMPEFEAIRKEDPTAKLKVVGVTVTTLIET